MITLDMPLKPSAYDNLVLKLKKTGCESVDNKITFTAEVTITKDDYTEINAQVEVIPGMLSSGGR